MDHERLNQFLWYGYFIDPQPVLPVAPPSDEARQACAGMDEAALVQRGTAAWRAAVAAAWSESQRENVIPLSGGLDSRAILAALLEHTSASCLETYTYGLPGTWDFELGNRVAAAAGTRHYTYDLTRYAFSPAALQAVARRSGLRTAVFHDAPLAWIERDLGPDKRHWLGFMGDPLAGSHLLPQDSVAWEQAVVRFARRNRWARFVRLTAPGYQPEGSLPGRPLVDARQLGYDEQLDFAVRQRDLIEPHVLLTGLHYQLPFLQPGWVEFILSVPRRWRAGQRLYRSMLRAAYPRLFSLPTKTNYGLRLDAPGWAVALARQWSRARSFASRRLPWAGWPPHPQLNYIDFDRGLRRRTDLRTVVDACLQALQRRGLVTWIDVAGLWRQHQRGAANHGDALTLLASLELILQLREAEGVDA